MEGPRRIDKRGKLNMLYFEERRQIIRTCRELQGCEYFIGTWGNVSMRIGDHILLTPSKVAYDSMQEEDMVVINLAGEVIEGSRTPTSEKEVHRSIYCVRDDVRAVVHSHTLHCMAVSAIESLEKVPALTEEMSQLLGGAIPLTRSYVPAGSHRALGEAAAEAIGSASGVILRNHGGVACGRTMEETVLTAKVMEKNCHIYMMLRNGGDMHVIPEEYVQSERYRFLYAYGHETNV